MQQLYLFIKEKPMSKIISLFGPHPFIAIYQLGIKWYHTFYGHAIYLQLSSI